MSKLPSAPRFIAVLLAVSALNVVLGQVEFSAYDSSMLIDVAWRLHLGQAPYRDFPCMLPPSFYLLAKAALSMFGVHWWAFTVFNSLIWLVFLTCGSYCIAICTDWLGPHRASRLTLLYTVSMAIPLLSTNILWHSAFTSESIVLLMLLLFLQQEEFNLGLALSPQLTAFSFLTAATVWLSKPNTALTLLLTSSLFVFSSRRRLRTLSFWSLLVCGSMLIAALILWLCSISPLQVIDAYQHVSGRPSPLDILGDFLSAGKDWSIILEATVSYAVVAALLGLTVLQLRVPAVRSHSAAYSAAIAGLLTTIVGFCTNWDIRMNDLPPALFGMSLLLFERYSTLTEPRPKSLRVLHSTLIFTVLIVLIVGIRRTRMEGGGPWAGDVYGSLSAHEDKFFGPFLGRDDLWKTIAIIDRERQRFPHAKFFFGYRLEYEYARLNVPSPRYLPVWWHPGSSYQIGTEHSLAAALSSEHFDILCFPANDIGGAERFPAEIQRLIAQKYVRVSPPDSTVDIYHLQSQKHLAVIKQIPPR